jgi:hypothetical protein
MNLIDLPRPGSETTSGKPREPRRGQELATLEVPALTSRGILRVNWEQRFEERLKEQCLIRRSHYYPDYLLEAPIIVRRNNTLRALCGNGSLNSSPFDVFVVKSALRDDPGLDGSIYGSVLEYIEALGEARRSSASMVERALRRRRVHTV